MSALRGAALGIVVVTVCAALGAPAAATPAYAIRAGSACDTCHVEPMGWHDPASVSERRCSLDCSTCHTSPTGGGLRTPSGQFYGREVLPSFGQRPSAAADPERHLPDGAPTRGRYRIGEGFSGWRPGEVWHGDIDDRFGDIEPDPDWSFGGDGRLMAYLPTDGRDASVFPMQASLYGRWRMTHRWSVLADAGLYSSRAALDLLPEDQRVQLSALDYLAVRELFVTVDRLPSNSWVRAGRVKPTYGWRMPDHTSFVRRDLGFDQDRSVYGVEAGTNPNYPFANAALFVEGLDGWPGDVSAPGWGASANGGLRRLGWQLQGSVHWRSEWSGGHQLLVGPQYGLNLYPVVLLGELDLRRRWGADDDDATSLAALHAVDWQVVRGWSTRLEYQWFDETTRFADDHRHRLTAGTEWRPVGHVGIELQLRSTLAGGGLLLLGAEPSGTEVLGMVHGWF